MNIVDAGKFHGESTVVTSKPVSIFFQFKHKQIRTGNRPLTVHSGEFVEPLVVERVIQYLLVVVPLYLTHWEINHYSVH